MKRLILEPHVGIGDIKLGMKRTEVRHIMNRDFISSQKNNVLIDAYYDYCFHVHYNKQNRVDFIELANAITNNYQVFFKDISIFNTKSQDLVSYLEDFSNYNKDSMDAQLGYMYIFDDIGLTLWRSNVFKEDILNEAWFHELAQEEKNYLLKQQYFESVSMWTRGYYD